MPIQKSKLREQLSLYDYDSGYFGKYLKDQIILQYLITTNAKQILDVGAHNCYINELLYQKGHILDSYFAIDIEDTFNLEYLHNNGHTRLITEDENTTDVIGNLDQEFDCILLLDVIEHLDNKQQGLKLIENAAKKLLPGGHLLISTPNTPVGADLNWPKYHEYEFHFTEIFQQIDALDLEMVEFIGWSATDKQIRDSEFKEQYSLLPTGISRALWAYQNAVKARDVLYILKDKK